METWEIWKWKSIAGTPIPGGQIPKKMSGNLIINIIKKNLDRPFLKTLTSPICVSVYKLPGDIAPYCFDGEHIVLLINRFIILLRFIIYCRFDWRHHNRDVSYIFYLNSIFHISRGTWSVFWFSGNSITSG